MTAKIRTRFVLTATHQLGSLAVRDYNVEEHQGQASRTIGRVYGSGRDWIALGIGMDGWTSHYPSRALAVEAMRQRRTFQADRRAELAGRLGWTVEQTNAVLDA